MLVSSTIESKRSEGVITHGNILVQNSSIADNGSDGGDGVVGDEVTIAKGIVFLRADSVLSTDD